MKKKCYIKLIVIQAVILYSSLISANNTRLSANLIPNWDPLIAAKNNQPNKLTMHDKIKTITLQQGAPLWRHVQFFADKNGELSRDSMKPPHDHLGIKENVEFKILALLNILDRRQLSHTVDNLVPVFNPASSGIWDINGNFIEEKFNQLAAQAILDNGNQIITKDIFNAFLQTIPRDGTEKDTAATVTIGSFIVDITWEQVTTGSANELFEFLSDYTLNRNGKDEKAFTVNELRRFYESPDQYMQEVIDRRSDNKQLKLEKCPYMH